MPRAAASVGHVLFYDKLLRNKGDIAERIGTHPRSPMKIENLPPLRVDALGKGGRGGGWITLLAPLSVEPSVMLSLKGRQHDPLPCL